MKFLDTNITVQQFVDGLRKSSDNLNGLFYDWTTLDEKLQIEYLIQMYQLQWLLTKSAEYIEANPQKDNE